MKLKDRVKYFETLFIVLQETNSRIEKQNIVDLIPLPLKDDFNYILECLAGKHKFGYRYYKLHSVNENYKPKIVKEEWTIKDLLDFLQTPMIEQDLTEVNIHFFVSDTLQYSDFLEPIVNRTLRLGIGNSLLEKDDYSPMLAKKYEGNIKKTSIGYYITEKLDGNRCIARYDGEHWIFTSRNGKEMHVDFDMSGLPTDLVYDGEILSPKQVEMSNKIYNYIVNNVKADEFYNNEFSNTSGLINTHNKNKDLIYNIFDIMQDRPYYIRRNKLEQLKPISKNVRILPLLANYRNVELMNKELIGILNKVVEIGGEGVMINVGDAIYSHKRTDDLLKLKKVQTMDMLVEGTILGTGKYEGLVGALMAIMKTDDGKEIYCKIGSGLTDKQRLEWAIRPDKIIGKIIEVSYFSLSQDIKTNGSNRYSLRFPRLTKVREDKNETSEY